MKISIKSVCSIANFILLAMLLNACSSKVGRVDNQNNASFFVDGIEGSSEVSKVDALYAIPKERLYNFKACLKDLVQSRAILGQSFVVSGGSVSRIVKSNEQGCLVWSEPVEFNFLAQANHIKTSRIITANGVHKGSVEVELAINPWSRGEDSSRVVDLSKSSVSKLEIATSALTAKISSPLWAIAPRVTISEKEFSSSGAKMSLKLQSKLALILKNSNNQNIQYPLNSGLFDIEFVLFTSADNKVIAVGNQKDASFIQDQLVTEMPFELNQLVSKGQVYLSLKIIPHQSDIDLDSFNGIFMISDNGTIKFDGTPVIAQDQRAPELKNQNIQSVKNDGVKPGLDIDKLDIRFFKIGNESTTDRQVFFTVKACVKSNLDNRPIRNESFSVVTISGKMPISIISNQEGCISWDDFIWHKFFGKESFVEKSITIQNEQYNLKKQIQVLVNPWDNGSNFARDKRFVEDQGSLQVNPSSKNAQLSIDSYAFSVNNYGYDINKNLDLSLIKNGTLSISAKVVNHSSLSSGRMGQESLRDGQYALKWAVVLLDKNNRAENVLSSGEKLVTAFGGDIKTDVAIKIAAFDKLNVRARLALALYTIKENKSKNGPYSIDRQSGLEATPFAASIILNNDQDGQKMQRIENNFGLGKGDLFDRLESLGSGGSSATEAMDKALNSQNFKRINLASEKDSISIRDGLSNPLKYYTQKFNPAYYHEAQQKPAIANATLASMISEGKLSPELARSFCSYWFNDFMRRMKPESKSGVLNAYAITPLVSSCQAAVYRDPSRFFTVEKKILIKKIGNINFNGGNSTNISVGNSFNVSNAESTTKSQAWSWNTSVGLSFDLFEIFKVGTNGSYNVSLNKSKSNTTTNSAQINASTYLTLQASSFTIELTSYEDCASIRLNPELFMNGNRQYSNMWAEGINQTDMAKAASAGMFICRGVTNQAPKTIKESYFLLAKDPSSSHGQLDAYSEENQQFFMTFRGKKDLARMLTMIQGQVKNQSGNSLEQNLAVEKSSLASLTALPTLPGIYSAQE